MANIAKKNAAPPEVDTTLEEDMVELGFSSLDDLAMMMVEALTLPAPTDFSNANGSEPGQVDPLAPQSSKRIN